MDGVQIKETLMALKKSQLIDLFMKSQKKTTCNYQKAINSLAEEIRELKL